MKNSKLAQWRQDAKKTQADMATLLGVDERTYRRWESGNSRTPKAVMLLIQTMTAGVKE